MRDITVSQLILTSFIFVFSFLGSGCETAGKKDMGMVIGSVLGGFIGHKVDDGGAGGVIIGALAGGAVGRMIGSYMDERDRQKLTETIDHTPRGQTVSWHNDDSGHDFEVTPTTDYYAQGDRQCRKFDQVVYVDGRREVMEGTACKAPGSQALDIEGSTI